MTDFRATAESEMARVAGRQYGVISTRQLVAAGLDRHAVAWRVKAGRLHRLHRGVYAVGHRSLSWRGRWTAAVLAAGPGAALSHHSAAALWELIKPLNGPVDLTVPGDFGRRRRAGLAIHRSRTLDLRQITRRHGIPVTTPARTIADLDGTVEPYLLRGAIRQAELAGHRLGAGVSSGRTRSDLERDFLRFCRRHGIPRPEVNVRVGTHLVDFLWREARVAVETDSWNYHRGSVAFEDDHERDLALRRAGFEVRRFTGAQLERRPEAVAADLREVLGRAS
jgi:very-short-patch-repair endonuclease